MLPLITIDRGYRIVAINCSLPRASLPLRKLVLACYLVGLREFEVGAVSKHSTHDDGQPVPQGDPHLAVVTVGLARAEVVSPFGAAYLPRRVAWDTDGGVGFEAMLSEDAAHCHTAQRVTVITHTLVSIDAWHVRRCFSFDRSPACVELGPCDEKTRMELDRNDKQGREGGIGAASTNVILFDAVPSVLFR
jgi:hypothetical protein